MEPPYILTGSPDDAEAYRNQRGEWTVASLTQSIGWTEKPITVDYAGNKFLLLPEDANTLPAIAMIGEHAVCRRAILEFASALAWSHRGAVAVKSWGNGNHIYRTTKQQNTGQITARVFQIDYLPYPTESNQRLALALFHEGTNLMHIHTAYSFLSFYKIVNLISGHRGDSQKQWINARVPLLMHHRSQQRLAELHKDGMDIGNYIYQSCRCAIAHAGDPRNPVIDPHDWNDEHRLRSDLPVVVSLAEIAIEEMGIKTSQKIYEEHHYELSGFEQFFSAELIQSLKEGKTPSTGRITLPPRMSLRMWGQEKYPPFEDMSPVSIEIGDGIVAIKCALRVHGYTVNILLDFLNYRLNADIAMEEDLVDDGSAEFIETTLEIERFFWDWNCNGCLEVWGGDTECIGRCGAFLPSNVFMVVEEHAKRISELKNEITRRPRRSQAKAT